MVFRAAFAYPEVEVKTVGGLFMDIRLVRADADACSGLNFKGLSHITVQTGVLIGTLAALGAKMRWASYNVFSIGNHAAAAIAKAGTSTVFAWKGKTLPEYLLVHRPNEVRSCG